MPETDIVKCTKCANLMLTSKHQKTKICPYCGTSINLQHTPPIATASNAFEASEIIRQLKTNQGFNRKP